MSEEVDVVTVNEESVVITTEDRATVVVVPEESTVLTVEPDVAVVTVDDPDVVVAEEPVATFVSEGQLGPPGPPGPPGAATLTAMALANVGGHRAVAMTALNSVRHADNLTPAHVGQVVGVSLSAASIGGGVVVQTFGEVVEPSWAWTPGLAIYVGADGVLVQSPPVLPAVFSLIVGFATSPTSMYVDVRDPIILA